MADEVSKANNQDAVSIAECSIVLDGVTLGYMTSLTVDGRAPEDIINCFGGTLRRRKPETVEWSSDGVVLYDNLKMLNALRNGDLFQIVVTTANPDITQTANLGQIMTVYNCRVNDHNVTLNDSSTFKMNGRADNWDVETIES